MGTSFASRTAREGRQDRQVAKSRRLKTKAARAAARALDRQARVEAGIVGAPIEGLSELETARDAFDMAVRARREAKAALNNADFAVAEARRHLEALQQDEAAE